MLGSIDGLEDEDIDFINDKDDAPDSFFLAFLAPDTPNLVTITQAVSAIIIIAAVVIVGYQLLMLILHCLGLWSMNYVIIVVLVRWVERVYNLCVQLCITVACAIYVPAVLL